MNPWHDSRLLNVIASAMLAVLTVALLVCGVVWVAKRPMFELKAVVIDPAPGYALRHVSSPQIRDVATSSIRGNFFTIDLDSVRSQLQAVPWVRQVSVRRVWPDRLEIGVEEHRPFGIWSEVRGADPAAVDSKPAGLRNVDARTADARNDGRVVATKLINNFGELFNARIADAESEGPLPSMSGPSGSEQQVMRRYEDMQHWLADLGRRPTSVALSPRYAWTVRLDDDTQLMLGRDQGVPIEDRVKRWAATFPQVQQQLDRKAEVIDLRYPSGFAIRSVKVLDAEADKTRKPGVSVAKLNR